MFRPASRALLRAPGSIVRSPATTSRRLISSTPSGTKSRSWKSTFVRLGLAAGAVYYYNTSSVFAESPSLSFRSQPKPTPKDDDATLPTLESVKPKSREAKPAAPSTPGAPATPETVTDAENAQSEATLKSAEELEAEAGQEAAFNPETGEINWDCPCLGGMAYGPCGEEFRNAFSCFVYSEEEPKGIDCIDKFKAMQDCFRQYPEVYGAELEDDEPEAPNAGSEQPLASQVDASTTPEEKHEHAKEARDQVKAGGEVAETGEVVPKAWHESEVEKAPEQQTEK
ncbi:Putative Mitochondrial intermembrane space import and assembly protein 40 [Aspergillus calidoustus]|uniref:Mitochondrial intermembrane space import and assembly protein 40 n=1 Tax=Aspergillus calidoustus TaxID=454130 RepID=A0A0U5GR08_ASPCI|nr:Putative Mitochondrial intermembrane space import and assembly protein 40 [Aspergillus calidoustus]